jgi:pimeloyl-ACP methyl ester carboxylesterase
MNKKLRVVVFLIVVLSVLYFLGPTPEHPVYEKNWPSITVPVDQYVKQIESAHTLKPGNEAEIVWANDSLQQQTNYSIVYLHGFSASKEEGAPVHKNIAKEFGCNLYLSRLADHGLDTSEPLLNFTAEKNWQSAKEALAIGKKLGHKVILMGTSTGASNALQLAAAYPDSVYALILLSPNIAINDPLAWVANNHWGLQIGRLAMHGKYVTAKDQRPIYKQYWYSHYRLEAVAALQEMLETSMTDKTFKNVKQPTLLLYYFKDEQHQDPVVKVSAMLKMFDELGSAQKEKKAMPNTEDHVLGSYIKSKDVAGVQKEIEQFMTGVLGIKPIAKP